MLHSAENKSASVNGGDRTRRASAPAIDAQASPGNLRSAFGNQSMLRMRGRGSGVSPLPPSRVLQRKCACGGTCSDCAAEAKGGLQRSVTGAVESTAVPPIVHEVLRSPGQPLDATTRADMETRFGHDFSQVRVHADEKAAESARAVNALAYTVGRNVVFGPRQYVPQTSEGRRLMAHELTHVLQQSGNQDNSGTVGFVARSSDKLESEADTLSQQVIASRSSPDKGGLAKDGWSKPRGASAVSVSPLAIQRDERPWPFNGYVINDSDKAVTVWSDDKGEYTIPANSTSGRFSDDVDHIKDKNGNWYKIGAGTVTVDKAGNVTGYKCKVSKHGEDCPQQ